MVNYPGGTKKTEYAKVTSSGGRGMDLEKEINRTNAYYLDTDRAVIHKKPTPVTIVKVDYPKRSAAKITEAYFKIPSTTDYNGIYRGKYLDFEAKECALNTSFPLKSVHPHQIVHLDAVLRHGALAFMIVRFTKLEETYFVEARKVIDFWNAGERRSIPYKWFAENGFLIPGNFLMPVDYLKIVDRIYFNEGG
jgi:recombination protein U